MLTNRQIPLLFLFLSFVFLGCPSEDSENNSRNDTVSQNPTTEKTLNNADIAGNKKMYALPAVFGKVLEKNAAKIGDSRQIVLVTNERRGLPQSTLFVIEKENGNWYAVFEPVKAVIGRNGFAKPGEKREGDGKTPTGIYQMKQSFGYNPVFNTKMPYRQTTENDYWVDDPKSPDYNTRVQGKPEGYSAEKLRFDAADYKYVVVIEYNTNPIVKGKGSAIFFHVGPGEMLPTAGCVAVSEQDMIKILKRLAPTKKPLIIMGTEQDLRLREL